MAAVDFMLDKTHQPTTAVVAADWPDNATTNNGDAASASAMPTAPHHKRLDGKVAIVIGGGARGIGEAIVRTFVWHGALVVIADTDDDAGEALATALGTGCTYVRCDVSQEADVERAVERALALHGRLDVLCSNAGVLGRQAPAARSIASLDAAEFDGVMRVSALGAALCMKHAARAMLDGRAGGSIVSVASAAGPVGGLCPHAYTASKHALVGLTKNAVCELGRHGIRVNCVSPLGEATPLLGSAWREEDDDDDGERRGAPSEEKTVRGMETHRAEDVAEAALFLASDESRYVSGHNLVVDGGGATTARNTIGL